MWEATAFFLMLATNLEFSWFQTLGSTKGDFDRQRTGIPNADSMVVFFLGGVLPPNPWEATSEVNGLTLAKDQAFQGAGQWFYVPIVFAETLDG